MEHGASERVKEQSRTVMTVKEEVDKAAQCTAYRGVQTNANFTDEEPRLVELVKSEAALLVKKEVVGDGWQDIAEQQCVQGPSTSAIVGSANVFDTIGDLHNTLSVKEELGAIDIGPTVFQHTDMWYTTNQKDVSVIKQERTINHDKTDPILCGGVKEEIIEDERRADAQHSNKAGQSKQRAHSQSHICDKCGKTYTSKRSLMKHCRNLHSTESHKCTKCNKKFPSKNYLYKHTRYAHSEQQYDCAVCKKIYKSKVALRMHARQVHRRKPADIAEQQCVQGPSTSAIVGSANVFDTIGDLHNTLSVQEELGAIDIGPTVFQHTDMWYTTNQKDVSVIKQERTINHDKTDPILCGGVKEEIIEDERRADAQHSNKAGQSKQRAHSQSHICDKCGKTYTSKRSLMKHRRNLHSTESHKCTKCNKKFPSKDYLYKHTRYAHSEQQYDCAVCKKIYKSKVALRMHARQVHRRKPAADTDDHRGNKAAQSELRARSQLYSCDKCAKTYTKKDSLLQHYRNLHSTESHKCTKCNKKFPSKAYLYMHTSNAHSEQQCECAVCKKICRSKAALTRHVYQVHRPMPAGSKAHIYTCDYCKKMFTDKRIIRNHIARVHFSGSYKCHQCDKIFRCKEYLMQHAAKMHPAGSHQLHTCTNCGRNFKSKWHCQRHECTRPTASNTSAVASTSRRQPSVVIVKEEPADGELELGPTVFQHMDCNYRPYKLEPELD